MWEQKRYFSSCWICGPRPIHPSRLSLLLLAVLLGLCALRRAGWPTFQTPQGMGPQKVLSCCGGVGFGRFVPMMSPQRDTSQTGTQTAQQEEYWAKVSIDHVRRPRILRWVSPAL